MTASTAPSTVAPRDTAARRLTAGAVLAVAGIAATVSFVHIRQVALDYGQTDLAALLLPFSIDGTVIAASSAMLRAARAGLGTPRMGRFMLALAVLATLACNVAYGLPHGPVGAAISGWPAVAFIGCAELAIGMARKLRNTPATTSEVTAEVTAAPTPDLASTTPEAAPAARPETGSRPTPPRPRGRARTPVTERDAEVAFKADLAAGVIPPIRTIRDRLRVGYDRAKALQDHLKTVTPEQVVA